MQDTRRYYSLDALRGWMMLLGILIHGAMWYLSEPLAGKIQLPTDPSTSYFFDILVYFIHSFRMPLFFLLAGFFTSLLIEKRGLKGTYINRGKRILGPLLAGMVTVLPLSLLFGGAFLASARFNTHQLIPDREQIEIILREMAAAGVPTDVSLGHLWFLYYLLYFYLTIPLCIAIVRACQRSRWLVDDWLAHPATILLLGLCTGLTLWPYKGGSIVLEVGYLRPDIAALVHYEFFYVLGYVMHQHRGILNTFKESIVWAGAASLVLLPLSIYVGNLDMAAGQPSVLVHGATVLVRGFCTWTLIYTLMGLFLRYLDTDSPWILYISQSSYWVYLLHMPVVSFAAWWVLPYNLHAFVKFPLIVLFTVLVCFVSYHYLVQRTWVSDFLNGRRFNLDWPWSAKPR